MMWPPHMGHDNGDHEEVESYEEVDLQENLGQRTDQRMIMGFFEFD